MRKKAVMFICLCGLLIAAVAAEAVEYRIHDLGTFGGTGTRVVTINNSGQALIGCNVAGDDISDKWFLWENGQATQITGLRPFELTNNGQVVGYISGSAGHVGYWQNGAITDLGAISITPTAINDDLQFVGYADNSEGWMQAYTWENGIATELPVVGGLTSWATAINGNGDIVGCTHHAWLYKNGVFTDLGAPVGGTSAAVDINDAGQITGYIQTQDWKKYGFIWQDGTMTALPEFGIGNSEPYDINNLGQVVGISLTSDSYPFSHAVVWRDGQIIDLGTLGGLDSTAWTINDSGWIGGRAQTADGVNHAVLWEPVPVPEPSSILALLSGLGGLGMIARRRIRR